MGIRKEVSKLWKLRNSRAPVQHVDFTTVSLVSYRLDVVLLHWLLSKSARWRLR